MEKFTRLTGLVMPLDRANVDTDAIIPKQYLKSIQRTGFGRYLFDEWRYLDHGEPGQDCSKRPRNPDFVLNQECYNEASILLARANFGCGSSREHAPWALRDYGFRCIIAPGFADIFFNNCFKNGILAIILDEDTVDHLFDEVFAQVGYRLTVDLESQTLTTPEGRAIGFAIDTYRKQRLLHGLDDIDLTLAHIDEIRAYEQRRQRQVPWLFEQQAGAQETG